MRIILFALLLAVINGHTKAQATIDVKKPPLQGIKEKFDTFRDTLDDKYLNTDTLASQTRQLSDEQFRTIMALERHKQKEVEDEDFKMKHRWRSFTFQYTASKIIFILVILIVLAGLSFSAWQFSFSLKQIRLKEKALQLARENAAASSIVPAPAGQSNAQVEAQPQVDNNLTDLTNAFKTDIDVTTTGIKANSSVLGVIILVISIVFFYLYIMFVYPIKYVESPTSEPKTEKTSSGK